MKTKLISVLIIVVIVISSSLAYFFYNQRKVKFRPSGAYRALNLWSFQRAYPNASIPKVGHYAAYELEKMKTKPQLQKRNYVPPWRAIGPHNNGGRTLALAFNPKNPDGLPQSV